MSSFSSQYYDRCSSFDQKSVNGFEYININIIKKLTLT